MREIFNLMKKSLIIPFSLLAAMFISCKNNEQSKQLGSSVSQSKENASSTSNNNSSNDISVEKAPVIETGIYQDKDSLYHLKYVLETGKTYTLNSKSINKQITTFRDKSQTISQETYEPVSFTVISIKDEVYNLQVKLSGKKVITKAEGQQVVFDTNGKKPDNPDQARMWKIQKAISENTFTMDMDMYGKISNISGIDAIYNKAKSSLSGDLKGKELDDFMTALKQGINPEVLKAQFESSMTVFPTKGLKIGEKWNNDPSRKNQGYNQLVKVDENTTEIRIQGSLPSQSKSDTKEGVTYKISFSGNQTGKIIIDNKSGWISSANFNITATETRSAKKGNQSEKVVQKTINNTYIN